MSAIEWKLDKTFSDSPGTVVRVLQRYIALETVEIGEELEPFRSLPSLIKISDSSGKNVHRGMVADFRFASGSLDLGFRTDEESGVRVRFHLDNVQSILLTVWRVNSRLDLIQFNAASPQDWLYLQTGGGELLEFLTAHEVPVTMSSSVRDAVSMLRSLQEGVRQ